MRQEPIQVIVTIVERGAGNRVTRAYDRLQVHAHFRCEGRGTATSEILDILGLGSTEKDVVLSLATETAARTLMQALDEDLGLRTKGIAFTVSLSGLSSLLAAAIQLNTKLEKNSGGKSVKQSSSSLIVISVNQGFTGEVMETAKKAGKKLTKKEVEEEIIKVEKQMKEAAKMLEFEVAAALRDQIIKLRGGGK